MTWLDHGPGGQLADEPTPRGGRIPLLSELRPEHRTMSYDQWRASLPREAFTRPETEAAFAAERARLEDEAARVAEQPRAKRRRA